MNQEHISPVGEKAEAHRRRLKMAEEQRARRIIVTLTAVFIAIITFTHLAIR